MTAARFLFSDSEVAAVTADGASLRIRFAAAHARLPDDTAFGDGRRVNVAGVTLVLQGGPWDTGTFGQLGRLSDGRLHDGTAWHSALPLPHEATGRLRLELRFADGGVLEADASAVRLQAPAEAAFIDSPAC